MSDKADLTTKRKDINKGKDYSLIKVSADYHAELEGFNFNSGDNAQSWLEAKAEIDNALQNSREFSGHLNSFKERSKIK